MKKSIADIPLLANEWHPKRNGDLTPKDITQGSVKKVWWLCSKSNDHEWESTVNNRTNGTGCPVCIGRKVSKKTNETSVKIGVEQSNSTPTKNII